MVVAGLSGRAQFGYLVYTVCCHLVALPFRANLDQQALPFPSEGAASCGANRALSAVRTHWSRLYRTENYGFGFSVGYLIYHRGKSRMGHLRGANATPHIQNEI